MAEKYAKISDIMVFRSLTAQEQAQAEVLIESASAMLRQECEIRGYDLDKMIAENEDKGIIAKNITVEAVLRGISAASENSAAVSQETQSGLGYSVSYSYTNAGQALYFLKNELKKLGILRQKYGVLEVYGNGT